MESGAESEGASSVIGGGSSAAAAEGKDKPTRVEGRGSSAAQRAAASEACKNISLERLQAQYHHPLSDVARDLKVSVARLLKKCREFGILRWPYRHIRSVQESIDQLEKDREAATDEMKTDDMELRLSLLRRRGELVAHFASCWLESDMRKGIFLADPRDVDAMLAAAHEVHGGRRLPPPGWESLGRFPDMAAREHFLEQMKAYMVGGASGMSPPDSPHHLSHRQQHSVDGSSGPVDDSRDKLRQLQMQQHGLPTQQQQQQSYHDAALQASWQQQQQQQQQPYQRRFHDVPQQAWHGGSHDVYGRGGGGAAAGGRGAADQRHHLEYQHPYWGGSGGGSGHAGMSEPMSAVPSGMPAASEYGGEYSPARGRAASPIGYPSNSWPGGQQQQHPSAAAASSASATAMGHPRSSGGSRGNTDDGYHRPPGAVAGMRGSSSSRSAWEEDHRGRASPGSAMDVGG
ncbi:unnamed protein product, partial [Pylaiella littoralis]